MKMLPQATSNPDINPFDDPNPNPNPQGMQTFVNVSGASGWLKLLRDEVTSLSMY